MADDENEIVPAGWNSIKQPTKTNFLKLVKQMFYNRQYTDCLVCIGERSFPIHRDLMRCYSRFFKEITQTSPNIMLPEEHISAEAFEKFLNWVFEGSGVLQRSHLMDLFCAAEFLGVVSLQDECWQLLDNSNIFVEEQAVLLYIDARKYLRKDLEQPLLHQLMRLMLGRVKRFFLMFVASLDFLQLEAHELCTMLRSNAVGVNNEIEVFLAVVRWLHYDWKGRSQHSNELFTCVRFTLMPPLYLCSLTTEDNAQVKAVMVSEELTNLITEALKYTCMAAQFGEDSEEMMAYLSAGMIGPSAPRQWIYDRNCKFHHRMTCSKLEYITYPCFLAYLEKIRDTGPNYWKDFEYTGHKDFRPCCKNRS